MLLGHRQRHVSPLWHFVHSLDSVGETSNERNETSINEIIHHHLTMWRAHCRTATEMIGDGDEHAWLPATAVTKNWDSTNPVQSNRYAKFHRNDTDDICHRLSLKYCTRCIHTRRRYHRRFAWKKAAGALSETPNGRLLAGQATSALGGHNQRSRRAGPGRAHALRSLGRPAALLYKGRYARNVALCTRWRGREGGVGVCGREALEHGRRTSSLLARCDGVN